MELNIEALQELPATDQALDISEYCCAFWTYMTCFSGTEQDQQLQ